MTAPKRWFPLRDLPPYTHIPGQTPHPISHPDGHSYGEQPESVPPIDPQAWIDSPEYLYGIDLFNHGFYWEAHEEWEGLWHTHERRGPVADFLKGLIQLAVVGVKILQEKPESAQRHAKRASELLQQAQGELKIEQFLGLSFAELQTVASEMISDPSRRALQPQLSEDSEQRGSLS